MKAKGLALAVLGLGGILTALGLGLSRHFSHASTIPQEQQASAPKQAEGDPQAADRAAIRKLMQGFLQAYEKGDARALAAHWTPQGEYISDDGTIIRGRAALEKAYTAAFTRNKSNKLDIDHGSLRFPSKDTAIEEGHFTVRRGKEGPTTSRYSLLLVREDGKWQLAVVREWPGEGIALRDLGWLIGTWVAKREGAEVHTTYEWWGNKSFIRCTFTIKEKDQTHKGFQMIGEDPSTGQLRSWTFDEEGGFGAAEWTREGNMWMLDSAGVLPEGSTLTATNILTRLDDNSFTWQSVKRTQDGLEMPDISPIRVTRVKSKK